jgi:hypothetical protein
VGSQQVCLQHLDLRLRNKPASESVTAKLITMTKAVNTINTRLIKNPSSWENLGHRSRNASQAMQQILIHRHSCFIPSATTVDGGGEDEKIRCSASKCETNGITTLDCS